MTSKEKMIHVLSNQPIERPPVFPLIMFLAADRLGVSYRQFATDGQIMADAQIKLYETFSIDAITACSDAFRVSADLGAEVHFPENQTPHGAPLVINESDLNALKRPDALNRNGRMGDRVKGVRQMVKAVGAECFVLGWVDLPFAEACSLCGVSEFMMMLYDNPELAHKIMDFLTDIVIDFCLVQLDEGADMIGCGDAVASLISAEAYRDFVLPYEQRVFKAIKAAGGQGKLHICGNTTFAMPYMRESGADLFNVDHLVDFDTAIKVYGKEGLPFKGNLDPVGDILQSDVSSIKSKVQSLCMKARNYPYIISAGCEIPATVSDEQFHAFCNAASSS
ncbi:MAG: uroporphyrinogen decarboxylase family protein [Spirochaetales bacterium]|nr:uroporphyrinogen decarboxylase family protein [Spirochaetales bacterium]